MAAATPSLDRAVFDTTQRLIFFVEGDDLNLIDFVCFFNRSQDGWSIIGPESNHAGDGQDC